MLTECGRKLTIYHENGSATVRQRVAMKKGEVDERKDV